MYFWGRHSFFRNVRWSISPTFYVLLFRRKVSYASFLYLHVRFLLFLRKNIGAKTALKMLVKLASELQIWITFCLEIYLKLIICQRYLIVEVVGQVLINGRHKNDVRLGQFETNVKENTLGQIGVCFVQQIAQTWGHSSQKTLHHKFVDEILVTI